MKRIIVSLMFFIIVVCTSACSGIFPINAGKIIPDRDATRIFEGFQCPSDFHYYFSGSDLYPHALIGVNKELTLIDATLWKKVNMTPEMCKEIISNMQTRALQLNQIPHGFSIRDHKGNRIGIWYSIMTAKTSVWMKDDQTAVIYTPDIDTYERYEKDSGYSE